MARRELAKKIYNKHSIKKMDEKIKLLGVNTKYDTTTFLNVRLFTSLIVFTLVLYLSNIGYILSPLTAIIYYYLFNKILVDNKIKKRRRKMEEEAIHFFEVLTLSLEIGRNLGDAIDVTVESLDGELVTEFKEAVREVKYGKSLTESLSNMQEHIPSDAINNIILTLTQADLFGNGIIDTMYNQVDYLREKRKMEVKADISKVPIKISIVSVLFFVPLILLIILAPIILSYLT